LAEGLVCNTEQRRSADINHSISGTAASPVPGWHLTMVAFPGTEVRLLEEGQGMTLFADPLARIFEQEEYSR